MKLKNILFLFVGGIVIVGIIFSTWRLTRPKFSNIDQELEFIVNDTVNHNKQLKNCLLYVAKGDGSFTWSGAAGIANQEDQVPMTKDTPIYLASVTKIFTATAIMKLYEQGKLDINDPMAKYLPENVIRGINVYQGHDYSHEITIAQLLSHTSGISDYYSEKSKEGKNLIDLFKQSPTRPWAIDESIDWVRNDMTPNFNPGEAASYSDTNYLLLGKIIETITGKPLEVVYEEFFFHPLRLNHTWLVGRSSPLIEPSMAVADVFSKDTNINQIRSNKDLHWADGGIVSTGEDAITFLKALNEGKIIHKNTLELMHNWRQLRNLPVQYGYGTMYIEIPGVINWATKVPPVWGHLGSIGSFLFYSPNQDLYIAGTINQVDDKVTPIMLMVRVMQAIH